MLGHYLAIALRNLSRSPFTALVNVATLSLGLVSFIAAYAVVRFWDNGEKQFANADRTYAITTELELRDGSVATGVRPLTTPTYAQYLRIDFPELAAVARANVLAEGAWVTAGDRHTHVRLMAVDPEFLDIFDLPFVAGDPRTALAIPNGVLVTEETAVALFGNAAEALGKIVTFAGGADDLAVTGVLARLAEPSHLGQSASAVLRFDVVMTYAAFGRFRRVTNGMPAEAPRPPRDTWLGFQCCVTYVLVKPDSGLTPAALQERLADFALRRMPESERAIATLRVGAEPVRNLMVTALDAQLLGSGSAWLSITTVLFGLGALVLLVACVNYANLATARAVRRAREVGMRRVIGASRVQVVVQHLLEAALLTGTALIAALAAVHVLAPGLQAVIGIDMRVGLFDGLGFWLFVGVLLAGVSLLGAAYPCLVLSRVRPLEALRVGRARGGSRTASMLLVGTQFGVTSFLLIAIIVMYSQSSQLRRTALGTSTDQYLVISNRAAVSGLQNDVLHAELARIPQVKGVTELSMAPWSEILSLAPASRSADATAPRSTAFSNGVGYDFFTTLEIPLLAGRAFDREHDDYSPPTDDLLPDAPAKNIMIDDALALDLGFASPAEAVGQTIYYHGDTGLPPRANVIIGVVASRALYLRGFGATSNEYSLTTGNTVSIVRLAADDVGGGREGVEALWRRLAPQVPFAARFMDDLFNESYEKFDRMSQAFVGLAALALAISIIGLVGMAVQIAGRRLHEIGVRKSLGARQAQIVRLLLRDFSRPVLIANLVAWPVAYVAAQAYLSVFIQRAAITAAPFVASLAIVIAVAWCAVGAQAWRAARTSPAEVLRAE